MFNAKDDQIAPIPDAGRLNPKLVEGALERSNGGGSRGMAIINADQIIVICSIRAKLSVHKMAKPKLETERYEFQSWGR